MLATLNHDSEVVLIMNKQLIRNEMLGGVQENEGLPPSEI